MNSELAAPRVRLPMEPGDEFEIVFYRRDRADFRTETAFKVQSTTFCRSAKEFEGEMVKMARAVWAMMERPGQ